METILQAVRLHTVWLGGGGGWIPVVCRTGDLLWNLGIYMISDAPVPSGLISTCSADDIFIVADKISQTCTCIGGDKIRVRGIVKYLSITLHQLLDFRVHFVDLVS